VLDLPNGVLPINLTLLINPTPSPRTPCGRLLDHPATIGGVRPGAAGTRPRGPGHRVVHLPAADSAKGAPGPQPYRHLREDGPLSRAAPGRARAAGRSAAKAGAQEGAGGGSGAVVPRSSGRPPPKMCAREGGRPPSDLRKGSVRRA